MSPALLFAIVFSLYRASFPFLPFRAILWPGRTAAEIALLLGFVLALRLPRQALAESFRNTAAFKRNLRSAGLLLPLWFPVLMLIRVLDPHYDAWMVSSRLSELFLRPASLLGFIALQVTKEEVLERGLLQPFLRQALSPRLTAIAMAIGFGVVHLTISDPLLHGASTWLGVAWGAFILAVLYLATGSLWICLIVHLAFDGLALLQTFLHVRGLVFFEMGFWVLAGIAAFAATRPAIQLLRSALPRDTRPLSWMNALAFLLVALAIPLGIILW